MSNIGTYNERTLHAALKRFYEPNTDCHEVKYKGYVADVKNDEGIIEIQTGSFFRMRTKLAAFLEEDNVTIVYPAVRTRQIVWIDPGTGEVIDKRKSPKKGSLHSVLPELWGIAELLGHERLTVQVIEVDVEEYKRLDGWGKDRKKGATKVERVPTAIGESMVIRSAADCAALVPETLGEEFTAAEFGKAVKLSGRALWQAMKFLVSIGVLECENAASGKAKKFVYRRAECDVQKKL